MKNKMKMKKSRRQRVARIRRVTTVIPKYISERPTLLDVLTIGELAITGLKLMGMSITDVRKFLEKRLEEENYESKV